MVPRRIAAVVLAMHGVAHAVGFFGSFQLGEFAGTPVDTTVLFGRLDVGLAAMQVLGVGWLVLAIAFVAVGVAVWLGHPRAIPALVTVAIASLVLSVLEMPRSTIGAGIDAVILGAIAVSALVRRDLAAAPGSRPTDSDGIPRTTVNGGTR